MTVAAAHKPVLELAHPRKVKSFTGFLQLPDQLVLRPADRSRHHVLRRIVEAPLIQITVKVKGKKDQRPLKERVFASAGIGGRSFTKGWCLIRRI